MQVTTIILRNVSLDNKVIGLIRSLDVFKGKSPVIKLTHLKTVRKGVKINIPNITIKEEFTITQTKANKLKKMLKEYFLADRVDFVYVEK